MVLLLIVLTGLFVIRRRRGLTPSPDLRLTTSNITKYHQTRTFAYSFRLRYGMKTRRKVFLHTHYLYDYKTVIFA